VRGSCLCLGEVPDGWAEPGRQPGRGGTLSMTPAPRRLLVAVAIVLLLLGVVVAGTAMMTVVALPLAVALGLTVLTVVGALGTRRRRRSGSRRIRETPDFPDEERGVDVLQTQRPSHLRWAMEWESAPAPGAVPFSRSRLTVVLAEWGLVGEAIEPALLVGTELLSNAIDHGRGPVRLAVELLDTAVRVEVHDGAPEPPQMQPRDLLRARGRGLEMVEALSSRWGWTPDPPGKLVWADVRTEWPDSSIADTITR
jgi:anti-sigma regulatory factor (Ser/Thr protein kinase)